MTKKSTSELSLVKYAKLVGKNTSDFTLVDMLKYSAWLEKGGNETKTKYKRRSR